MCKGMRWKTVRGEIVSDSFWGHVWVHACLEDYSLSFVHLEDHMSLKWLDGHSLLILKAFFRESILLSLPGCPWGRAEGQTTWLQRAITLRATGFLPVWISILLIYDLSSENTLIPTKAKIAYTFSKWLRIWLNFSIASSPQGHVIWACWKECQRVIGFISIWLSAINMK